MSAVIAVLVVLAAALAAGLSTQINQSWPNSTTEEPSNVAQSDETVPVDKPEQKHSREQADKHSVKREERQKQPACVRDCPAPWPHYELRAWPL
jgi:cytoskeletal protein RodZ